MDGCGLGLELRDEVFSRGDLHVARSAA
jgi:hypothetical protein